GYVLEQSFEMRVPLWVCERLSADDLDGPVTDRLKPEPFGPDPDLDRWPRAELVDYVGSGFARGHLSPDGNRTRTRQSKAETYFLSNMVPQAGGKFNSSIWLSLENKVRAWARLRQECWIITGSLVHDPAEDSPDTADGLVAYHTIGKSPVGVPTHLFKIILARKPAPAKADKEDWDALAFVFENRSYEKGLKLDGFLTSIQWIEDHAGFDFFPDPPPNVADIRTTRAAELWPTK